MLTPTQVREGATTPEKALELSIKHWWENYNIPKEELEGESPIAEDLCGLCSYYRVGDICGNCPVGDCDYRSLYVAATDANDDFCDYPTDENYQSWRKASKAMHKFLCSLRGKELKVRA